MAAFIYGLYFFQETTGWEPSDRGVSYRFGSDVVDAFLAKNNLSLIVRAHQVVEDGYEFFHERALVTLFSAPNYCGQFDNAGAMMTVKEDLTCSFSILPVSFFVSFFFLLKTRTNICICKCLSFKWGRLIKNAALICKDVEPLLRMSPRRPQKT